MAQFETYFHQIMESTENKPIQEAHTTDPGLTEWLEDKSAADLLEFIRERNPEIYTEVEDAIRDEMGYFSSEEKDIEDVTKDVEVPDEDEVGEEEEEQDEPDRVRATPEEIDAMINQDDEPEIDFDAFDPDND